MDLERLQRNWQNLGQADPLWAILSHPSTRGGNWDVEAFLRTGQDFVRWVAGHLDGLGVPIARGRALDFGCGHGRLSQALAGWFQEVVGVDIAESMLAGARAIDRSQGRVRYVRNDRADLAQFADASFDFVLTAIVLQHMQPDYARGYLREFVRVLRPGGVAFVQIPVEPLATPGVAEAFGTAPAGVGELRARTSVHPVGGCIFAGEWRWHRVRVTNVGGAAWPAGALRIVARWLRLAGSVAGVACSAAVAPVVEPGASVDVLLPVQAPPHDGFLQLAFLPVARDAWIESPDNPAARSIVQILPRAIERQGSERVQTTPCPPPPSVDAGRYVAGDEAAGEQHIEVYGLPIARVLETVRAAGGEVVDVGEDDWAGPAWLSAHYVIQKR